VVEHLKQMLREQLALMQAAAQVLEESRGRVAAFQDRLGGELTVAERESCESLTSRFARLNDFLVQRVFRTLDQIELIDEGSQPMTRRSPAGSTARFTSPAEACVREPVRSRTCRKGEVQQFGAVTHARVTLSRAAIRRRPRTPLWSRLLKKASICQAGVVSGIARRSCPRLQSQGPPRIFLAGSAGGTYAHHIAPPEQGS
jgi:hypothetical protein